MVSIGEGLEVAFVLAFVPPGRDRHQLVVKPHGARAEERETPEGDDPHGLPALSIPSTASSRWPASSLM